MSIERRTTKRGQIRYDVRLRKPDGTQYTRTFRTKKDAERFETSERASRQQGTWIDPNAGRISFADWAEEWYSTMVLSWRASTAQRHRTALDRHWLPELGQSRMASVSPRQVQQVLNRMTERLSPATVRSYYGTVRAVFGDAVDTEVISRSPCRGIKLPKADRVEKRIVSPDELHQLAGAVGPDWRLLIYLGGALGLRFGEATALRVSDVDLRTGSIAIVRAASEVGGKIHLGPPKTAASVRTVVMPEALRSQAEAHIHRRAIVGTDLLFADGQGGPVRRTNFRSRVWSPAVRAAGLDGLTFHGLRHSAATQWIADGIDARTVQQLLGHSDPRLVLKLYAHSPDQALSAAAQVVGDSYWPPR